MTKILDNNILRDMTAEEEAQVKIDQDNAKLEKSPIQKIKEQEELIENILTSTQDAKLSEHQTWRFISINQVRFLILGLLHSSML